MLGDLLELVWPRTRSPWLDRHRAEAIAKRVRAFAHLFAACTLVTLPLDFLAFGPITGARLCVLRLAAFAAFAALGAACRGPVTRLPRAESRLGLLFAIPAGFFVAAVRVLANAPAGGFAETTAAFYTFIPFVLAAGIGAFPLAAFESVALATIAVLAEGWALAEHTQGMQPHVFLDAFWLLVLISVVATFSAMSQLRLLEELVQQALRDPLTGCYRRESGKEFLDMQFLLAQRVGAPLTILFADLDRFKDVNDRFGHEAGDQVLATTGAALRDMVRESDAVLRWGGEEFVVVLPHTDQSEAVALLDRLRARGVGRDPDGRPVTLSIGLAELRADRAASADVLIELADQRMYQAKQAGRNRYVQGAAAEARTLLASASTSIASR